MRRSIHAGVVVTALLAALFAPGVAAPASALWHYDPPSGITFNNPMGKTAAKRAIYNKILRAINSVPRGQKIRIATWNFKSPGLTTALINAHKRGVSVRLTMDGSNDTTQDPNNSYRRLAGVLDAPTANAGRTDPAMFSWAHKCRSSCRGKSGISHTKLYLFSQVGPAHNVIMFGSVNATDAAALYQWNDMFTLKEMPTLWRSYEEIFDEMSLDKPVPNPYRTFGSTKYAATIYPFYGPGAPKTDIMLNELNRIRCTGARNAGYKGHTVVRIAQTGWTGTRGMTLARRVKTMMNRGCNIRVDYAMMGTAIWNYLRSTRNGRAVPMAHIVQDWNKDGIYDRYLHMKVLAVSGKYGTNPTANFVWNGSSNWTSVSQASDEELMKVQGPGYTRQYIRWIDHLFFNPPPRPELQQSASGGGIETLNPAGPGAGLTRQAPVRPAVNPYAHMELD